MLEKQVQKKILDWLNSLPRCKAVTTTQGMYGKKGEPDIDCCLRGKTVKIEVKRPGGRVTPLQSKRLAEWKMANAHAFVAFSLDDVRSYFKEHGL